MNKQQTCILLTNKTFLKLKGMAKYHGYSMSVMIEQLIKDKRFNV